VVSPVGLAAIGFGIAALKARKGGLSAVTSVVGMILGGLGTAAMVVSLLTFYLTPGHSLAGNPPIPLELAPVAPVASSAPVAPAAPVAPRADERATLAQTVGTIVFLLKRDHDAGFGLPTTFAASSTGHVVTTSGSVRLPAGSQMRYQRWPDATGYDLEVVGVSGLFASYSTATGLVELH
jgi:hypothetical protein